MKVWLARLLSENHCPCVNSIHSNAWVLQFDWIAIFLQCGTNPCKAVLPNPPFCVRVVPRPTREAGGGSSLWGWHIAGISLRLVKKSPFPYFAHELLWEAQNEVRHTHQSWLLRCGARVIEVLMSECGQVVFGVLRLLVREMTLMDPLRVALDHTGKPMLPTSSSLSVEDVVLMAAKKEKQWERCVSLGHYASATTIQFSPLDTAPSLHEHAWAGIEFTMYTLMVDHRTARATISWLAGFHICS